MGTNFPPVVKPSKNLQSALNWSMFAMYMAPTILQLVAAMQQLLGKGNGAAKSQAVQTVLASAAPGVSTESVQPVIDASVQALKDANHPAFTDPVLAGPPIPVPPSAPVAEEKKDPK